MKKKIIIVGSSGNLGGYIFKELKKKYNLIGIERKKSLNTFECKDLSNSRMNLDTFKLLKKTNSKLDAIIICTGKSGKDLSARNDYKFLNSFKSNLLTISNTIDSYQKIYKNKPTKIIVISSIAGIKIMEAPIEYSISKSALNHYCQIKAKELSKFKIKLNIISPGNIMNKNNNWYLKIKTNNNKIKNYIKKNVPLNSFCKPDQILAVCKLLISDDGNFFQGSNIVMDGGQIL
jgi:NAD(P)-dependent dehydrogenase (short-subunit alcohol dehydrogenase family)